MLLPAQCRAARALLRMTQPQLAAEAKVGLSSVVEFEKERRAVSGDIVLAIRHALERAGCEWIPENGGGEGVRRRERKR